MKENKEEKKQSPETPDPASEPMKLEGKLNVANVKPFTKYRLIEMILCAAAVILGLLYLYADHLVPLSALLPLYCAGFFGITLLRALDAKATGSRGLFTALTIACWGALGIAMVIATAVYFTR